MAAFIRNLFAQRAFIEQLESVLIQVKAAIFGGERFVKENGQVKDLGSHLPGFCLDKDGKLRASGAEISGHVKADSGELNNVTIKEGAVFLGTIHTGPVFISNETTAPVAPRVFNSGTSIGDIMSFLGGVGTFNINGSYGNRSDLVSVVTAIARTITIIVGVQQIPVPNTPVHSLRLIFSSGNDVYLENTPTPTYPPYSGVNSATINQQLSIGGSSPGKIFRIHNLPTGGAGLPSGTVYRNGNQLMIV
jgi:hypothetical protein